MHNRNKKVVSKIMLNAIRNQHQAANMWPELAGSEVQKMLSSTHGARKYLKWLYVDTYHRTTELSPIVFSVAQSLQKKCQHQAANFWIQDLAEQNKINYILFSDLLRLFKNEHNFNYALHEFSLSPQSATLLGFLFWHAKYGNPHILAVYRLYSSYIARISRLKTAQTSQLLNTKGIAKVRNHSDDELKLIQKYVDQNFKSKDIDELVWCIDFITAISIQRQIWVAQWVLKLQS